MFGNEVDYGQLYGYGRESIGLGGLQSEHVWAYLNATPRELENHAIISIPIELYAIGPSSAALQGGIRAGARALAFDAGLYASEAATGLEIGNALAARAMTNYTLRRANISTRMFANADAPNPAVGRIPPFKNDILPNDVGIPGSRFELVNEGGKYVTRAASGQVRSASGRYLFVKQNGKTYVVKEDKVPNGHIDIARGQPVEFAGELRFSGRNKRGRLLEWSNSSGHFQPPKEFAPDVGLPLDLFKPVK